MRLKEIDINGIQKIDSVQGAKINFDRIYYNEISSNKYQIVVEGWSIIKGIDINSSAIHALLQNGNDGKKYDNSGFEVQGVRTFSWTK